MQQSFFVAEVLRLRSLKIFNQKLEEVGQVVRDLVLACLTDVAYGRNQLLVGPLHVVGIRVVYLKAHIFNWVLLPLLELVLGNQQQRQGQVEENRLDVILAQPSHLNFA